MLFDTHAHLNFNAYKDDIQEVIKRSLDNNVWMINVGSQYSTSKKAVEIADEYSEGVYAAIGLHPIHLNTGLVKIKADPEEMGEEESKSARSFPSSLSQSESSLFDYEKYKELTKSQKVVAIGEIGLDYYYRPKTRRKLELFKEKQKELFLQELDLSIELNLPVIFHCRAAHDDLIEILNRVQQGNNNAMAQKLPLVGVIHCFTGTWEQAQKYLEMGLYLGFNGLIFKLDFDEIIKKTPQDRILIETDCPYLTPPSMEGRNEPLYVKYIAEKIAKIKNFSYEEISQIITENTKNLFNI